MKNIIITLSICMLLSLSLAACTDLLVPGTQTNPTAIIPPSNTPVQPTSPPPTAEPTPIPAVRQWATSAKASSQYSDPDWSANQATGAPDTLECSDLYTAWASQNSYGMDWLEVAYAIPVIPSEITIYESYTPDYVTLVEVLDVQGNYWPVYSATGGALTECPYALTIPVTNLNVYVYAVRITIDQTNASYWNEIDAVELVGIPDPTGQIAIPPTPTAIPFTSGECEAGTIPIEMNTEIEMYQETAQNYPDTCKTYCLWVPENGSQLDISISNFDIDLDMYVDTNLSVFAYEDHGTWDSNQFGDVDEAVSIFNPGGRYYIQVCSYQGLASTYLLYNWFTP